MRNQVDPITIKIPSTVYLDCYKHLVGTDANIIFLYGGRDSGKTYFIAQQMVRLCLKLNYFKCILVKKTANSIEETQFEEIKKVISKWGLSQFFTFRKNPLRIDCVNGNRFIAKGLDDPENVKGISEPSHVWYEEGNQLTEDDFNTVSTTLRSSKGRVQEWFSFNPECAGEYTNFWLYKNYFAHTSDLSFTNIKEIHTPKGPVTIKIEAVHSTYLSNRFCTPERAAKLEDLKSTSPFYYRVYSLGMWGKRENKSPFVLTFSRQKHVVPRLERDPQLPVILCFDFNRNPMCVSIVQVSGLKVRWLEVIKQPNTTIYQVCDIIKLKYPTALFIVCGDWTGINRSALVKNQDMDNYYKVIQQELRLTNGQMQYEQNPPIQENQVLVNHCLQHLDVQMDERTCQPLIFDYENAEVMPDGKLKKLDREDEAQQLDALDTARYLFNKFFKHLNPLLRKKAA